MPEYCKIATKTPPLRKIFELMKYANHPSKKFEEDKMSLQHGTFAEVEFCGLFHTLKVALLFLA